MPVFITASLKPPHRNLSRTWPRSSADLESQQALAAAVARRLYGFAPTAVVRLRSKNNRVFRVEFGGLPAKVIKLPGRSATLLREQRIIRALRQSRWALPVPAVEFTQDDLPPVWQQEGASWVRPRAVTIMPLLPGMTLADAVLRGERWAGDAMRTAGAFAALLAEVPPAALVRVQRPQSERQIRRALDRIQPVIERFAPAGLQPALLTVVEASRRPATSLAHGEFYPENVLAEMSPAGVRLTVLDWETARPGSPLADLAALGALVKLPPLDSGQAAYLRRLALDGFGALRPLSEADRRELQAWEVFCLLAAARFAIDSGRDHEAERFVCAAATAVRE